MRVKRTLEFKPGTSVNVVRIVSMQLQGFGQSGRLVPTVGNFTFWRLNAVTIKCRRKTEQ